MFHLKDETIIKTLIKQDPKLRVLFPIYFNHMKKSRFVLMLDALLEQIFTISRGESFRDEIYGALGVDFGPVDLLAYLNRKIVPRVITDMCNVCKDTLNLYNYTYDQMTMFMIDNLKNVKGIAPWTIKSMKIYTLCDLNIFSANDAYVKRSIKKIYKLKYLPGTKECEKIARKWAPYRSIVMWYLWAYRG